VALYTDSDVITPELLTNLDSEITSVASVQSIDVSGICHQAWDECADALFERMDSFGGYVNLLAGAGIQMATLLTNYGMGVSRSRFFLGQVIVTDPSANRLPPLARWMVYRALVLFYRDASARLGKDRYESKLQRFQADERCHAASLWRKGLPIVLQPLPCPGALHEFNAGTWDASNLSAVSGGSSPQALYDIAITWVDQTRYVSPVSKQNCESGPSAVLTFTLPLNELIEVSIASLNPPNGKPYGSSTFADGVLSPLIASGWNVYAAPTGGTPMLQNATPVPIATPTFTFFPAPGAALDPGQLPDANYAFENVLQRA